MPLHAGAVLTGHVVSSLVRNLLATGIVVGGSRSSWLPADRGPPRRMACGGRGSSRSTSSRSPISSRRSASRRAAPEAASGYGFILLFLPYLSSAFVPLETLPEWLRWFAAHQPVTPVIETIRSLLMGDPMGDSVWWALGWCALIVAFAAWWGVRGCSVARPAAAESRREVSERDGCPQGAGHMIERS